MAPDSVPPAPAVEPHVFEASRVLTVLDLQLRLISSRMEDRIRAMDPKKEPCTFQVYRFLMANCNEAVGLLGTLLKDAEIQLYEQPSDFPTLSTNEEISAAIDTMEARVCDTLFKPFKLDDLPAGNPGEKEFERLLKPKIATNRSYTALMHKLAVLHTSVFSDTYKLDISEDERVITWRAARKARLEAVLKDIDAQLTENEMFVNALHEAKKKVLERIEGNEQMTFDKEIDSSAPVESGD